MATDEQHAKLAVAGLGLAVGVTWALGVLLLGIAAWLTGWGGGLVEPLASLYIGYGPSFVGAVIGGIWAFFDGLIAGLVIAWLYNRFR